MSWITKLILDIGQLVRKNQLSVNSVGSIIICKINNLGVYNMVNKWSLIVDLIYLLQVLLWGKIKSAFNMHLK